MAKYTFISEESLNRSKVTFEFEAVSLTEMLEQFEYFLRGSGFMFDGFIDIVESEDLSFADVEDLNDAGEKVFASMVEGLNGLSAAPDELCTVCGISKSRMDGQKCWDEKCPMKEYNAN